MQHADLSVVQVDILPIGQCIVSVDQIEGVNIVRGEECESERPNYSFAEKNGEGKTPYPLFAVCNEGGEGKMEEIGWKGGS